MNAVVVRATINDVERGEAMLREEVVPRISQAPGFVSGWWTRSRDNSNGLSVVVFESLEAAEGVASMLRENGLPSDAVTLQDVEVRDVVANA